MFLTVHVAAGIVIGEQTGSSFWGFLLSLLSHFVLDMVPHGDQGFKKKGNIRRKFLYFFVADLLISAVMIMFLYLKVGFSHPLVVAASIVGSILPDVLWALYEFFNPAGYPLFNRAKNQALIIITNFDNFIHNFIKVKLPFYRGLALQVFVCNLLLCAILFSHFPSGTREKMARIIFLHRVQAEASVDTESIAGGK